MLFTLLIILFIVCLLVWLVSVAPIPAPLPAATIKWFLYAIVVIFAIYYLLRAAGISVP